jgi:hypothetical protein
VNRAAELRADFELLGRALAAAEGSAVAAIARERRLISAELEKLEIPEGEVPLVDQLAEKRARAGSGRPPSRRRKSG